MKLIQSTIATAILSFITAALAQTDAVTLKVGDRAPKLQVAKFVQGEPVKDFERGKAYIVEFWATWCGPCRVSIPHLNELHTKFKDKDLIVIGQDCWERDEKLVEPFIKQMGEKMTYRVALDLKDADKERGQMAETWMTAAGQNGIPTAFVVDKTGTIAWIGHPMTLKDAVLEQILAGTFDVKKAAAANEMRTKNKTEVSAAFKEFSLASRDKKWTDAMSALDKMEKLMPEEDRDRLGIYRFQLLTESNDTERALKLGRSLSDADKDNAQLQNALAWSIAKTAKADAAALKLAELCANRANDAASGKDAAILDTLARVHFLRGDKDKAILCQQKAVELAPAGGFKEKLSAVLASYMSGKLPEAE
ncbi:MAG TPA: redoxin domain-containing protein [Verrucomicrobiae bacterium]|jgi:thiol-disulfide isomerase/thioredoxin